MDPSDFTVGWIAALHLELAAAEGMLDEEYDASNLARHPRDKNRYSLGRIGVHKVALTCLPDYGHTAAGSVANHMRNTFVNLKFGLMVGIGGGVPSRENDIRLGDVVISKPTGSHSGVIQYDSGKFIQNGEFLITGTLPSPDKELLNAATHLRAKHERTDNLITHYINKMFLKHPKMAQSSSSYRSPGKEHDCLFRANYVHSDDNVTCAACDKLQVVARPDRAEEQPVTFYGNIASGNAVMKDARKRDQLGRQCNALCFEMEAAGLMNEFPCLVIRGICDYSDSHKNDVWQRYAAATAAAYAKELLGVVYAGAVQATPPIESRPFSPDTSCFLGDDEDWQPLRTIQSPPPARAPPSTTPPSRKFSFPQQSTSHFAGASRSSSIEPAETSPPFKESSETSPSTSTESMSPLQPKRSATHQQLPSHSPLLPPGEFISPSRRATVDQKSVSKPLLSSAREVDPGPSLRSTTRQTSSSHFPMAHASPNRMDPPQSRRSTLDHSRSSISSSIVRPPSLAAGAWSGREGEELLIEAQLVRYQSHGAKSQEPDSMHRCRFKLFELAKDGYSIRTKRIVIQSCEDEQSLVSYWMPLDDIHITGPGCVINSCEINLAWSDCSKIVSKTKNYQTTITCEYYRDSLNRRISLECEETSAANQLANILLYPTLTRMYYQEAHNSFGIDSVRVYKYDTAVEPSEIPADRHFDFAILTLRHRANSPRTSRICFGTSDLVFHMNEANTSLELFNMWQPKYTSSLEKSSENDFLRQMDPEGKPDGLNWQVVPYVHLSSVEFQGLAIVDFMEELTGWRQLFTAYAPCIILKTGQKFPLPKKIKNAWVMVWERKTNAGKELQLLANDLGSRSEPSNVDWLSASLTAPIADMTMRNVKPKLIDITVQACLRGPAISLFEMSVDASSASSPKAYDLQIQFEGEDQATKCHDVIRPHLESLRRNSTLGDKPRFQQHERAGSSSRSATFPR